MMYELSQRWALVFAPCEECPHALEEGWGTITWKPHRIIHSGRSISIRTTYFAHMVTPNIRHNHTSAMLKIRFAYMYMRNISPQER